ncbi:MAG: DUF2298 domain-containing protein [Chloroflexota bacterium]
MQTDRINRLKSRAPAVLLALILLVALALRLTGVNWDAESRLHPDERFMTGIVSAIGNPDNLTEEARAHCPDEAAFYDYFNTDCSVYNPDNVNIGSYAYGTLPLYIVRGAAQIVARINPGNLENPQQWAGYDYIHLVGRVVSALADTLVVLLVFLIGRHLFSVWHGLIAAALYACAILPIQLSHFWTVDPLSNLFFVLGLYAAVIVSKKGSGWAYLMFGAALGCAVASRINIAPMAALLPLAVLVRLQNEQRLRNWRSWLLTEGILVLGGAAVALLVFRVAQPYAFVGPTISNWTINERWQHEIEDVSNMSRLASDGWPPSVQWFDRIRYVYPWFEMMMWGMGLVVGVVASAALLLALVSQGRKRRLSAGLALLSLWVVGYFAVTGNVHQMTMRYYLPLYAALLLLATWLVMKLAARGKSPVRRWIAPAVVLAATAIAGISFVTTLYTQPITRVEASKWFNSTVPTTVDVSDGAGNRTPMTIDKFAPDLLLLTAYNAESYLSDPFELEADQPVRLEIQFNDARETQVRIQFLDARSDGDPPVVKEWTLQTDENGHLLLPAEEMPPIEGGRYAWHIAAEWSAYARSDAPGMTSPAVLRYYIPVMVVGSGDGATRQAVSFRNPYQSVPYSTISPEQNINLTSQEAMTVTELTFAHVYNDPSPITLTLGEETYTATPIQAVNDEDGWNTVLGRRQRYLLNRPMILPARTSVSMRADALMLFTGTAVATDGDWDDTLPTRYCDYSTTLIGGVGLLRDCIDVHAYARGYYNEVKLNMAETDSEVKALRMVDVLTKADYFIISSNRFYDAQPRVLRRFAMSTEFYNRLFNDELGYSLLNTFRRGSNFLGIEFPHEVLPTDHLPAWMNEYEAEEAFTVYDHPTVFVFKNDGFQRFAFPEYTPPTVTATETASVQTLGAPTYELATRPQTDDDVVFALILWTLGFVLLGWVAFPMIYALFPSLPLAGFAIGRGLAWLLLAVVPWWLTSVLGRFFWTRPGLLLLLIAFVSVNAVIAYRRRDELRGYLKAHWRSLLVSELIFLAAFGIGLLLRAVNPDLWQIARGGEKHMDFAYLNAVLATPVFPPPNPWMAGLPVNYYYFGFVIAALPIKIIGVASEVGYNLVLSSLYAVVFSVVFTLGYALLPEGKRILKTGLALVGAAYAMLAGNLGTLKLILAPEPGMEPNSHRWYWYPTRILGESVNHAGGAINEMPIFSFLFGDLHAHIIGLLPSMLLLTLMWVLYKQKRWWIALLIGVVAGTIYMTNIWDVLLYAPVGALLLWFAARNRVRFVFWGVLIAIGAGITVLPYLPHLSLGSTPGIEPWNFERSLIEPFVLVWGIPIGIAALWMLKRAEMVHPLFGHRGVQVSVLLIIVVMLLALDPILATTALCIVLTVAALLLVWRDAPEMRLINVGIALIFGLLLALEYVVVIGDVGRMNTVFKISFQLWMWVGLLIPLILFWTLRQRWLNAASIMLLLIAFGLLFPLYAVPARANESLAGSLTLDGDRFFERMGEEMDLPEGSVPEDLELIRYLRGHAQDYPVLAEWYETEYTWNGRMSVQTGLPAIVGWGNHMRQQYGAAFAPQVDIRIDDMRAIYLSEDINRIREVLREYNVRYIVVGSLERARMAGGTQARFDEMVANGELERVFTAGDSFIYRVTLTS